MIWILFLMLLIMSSLLTVVQTNMSSNMEQNKNNLTSLESGFETMRMATYFNLQYFLLAVLFVLFDVELILLLPCIMNNSINMWSLMITTILTLTLILEWQWTGLKWTF